MNIVGIIAEYNPFHNGHKIHLQKSKEITNSKFSIVVMSGNFVQRGEPSIIDKYIRTKFALINGADVVIEIPVHCSTSSAEFFASSAINLLNKTNIVTSVCFGSECGHIETLKEVAKEFTSESEIFKTELKSQLKSGVSYPKARLNSLQLSNDSLTEALIHPNNILAVEYLKALIKLNSKIKPFTIKRETSNYHSTQIIGNIASATAIRAATINGDFESIKKALPENIFSEYKNILDGNSIPSLNNLSQILHYIIRNSENDTVLSQILDVTEGLENRIIKFSNKNFYINDIISYVKTKRYTFTKLQRAVLHILLNITDEDFNLLNSYGYAPYIRVLGFRKESSFLLKEIEMNSSSPLITNIKNAYKVLDENQLNFLKKEIRCTDIYNLSKLSSSNIQKNIEYSIPLVIV